MNAEVKEGLRLALGHFDRASAAREPVEPPDAMEHLLFGFLALHKTVEVLATGPIEPLEKAVMTSWERWDRVDGRTSCQHCPAAPSTKFEHAEGCIVPAIVAKYA